MASQLVLHIVCHGPAEVERAHARAVRRVCRQYGGRYGVLRFDRDRHGGATVDPDMRGMVAHSANVPLSNGVAAVRTLRSLRMPGLRVSHFWKQLQRPLPR